jgi:hypothetical protein
MAMRLSQMYSLSKPSKIHLQLEAENSFLILDQMRIYILAGALAFNECFV